MERPGCRITEIISKDWNVRRTALSNAVIQTGWTGKGLVIDPVSIIKPSFMPGIKSTCGDVKLSLCIAWYVLWIFLQYFRVKSRKYIGFQFMVYMTLLNVGEEHNISLSKRLLSVQWPRLNSKPWNHDENPQCFWLGCHCCTVWLCCSLGHMTSPSMPSCHTVPASTTRSTCVGSENLRVGYLVCCVWEVFCSYTASVENKDNMSTRSRLPSDAMGRKGLST